MILEDGVEKNTVIILNLASHFRTSFNTTLHITSRHTSEKHQFINNRKVKTIEVSNRDYISNATAMVPCI